MSVFVTGAGVIPNTLLSEGYVQLENIESTGTQYINTNFIPCKNSPNEIVSYDMVSQSFYSNAGSGSFVAGPEL